MFEAGCSGPDVRSDCLIRFNPDGTDIKIQIESKVKALYGKQIEAQIREALHKNAIKAAQIEITDAGALPYVIWARLETAIRRAGMQLSSLLLPPAVNGVRQDSPRDRQRRSRLYLPGNTPHLFINAGLHNPDGVILDLEDSVSPEKKDAARALVRNALLAVDFYQCERMVRINQLPMGLEDLEWVVPHGVQLIVLPKCENADQVRQVDDRIRRLAPKRQIWLMPVIESAMGCFHALDICRASERIAAVTIGLEDYTADLGVPRTAKGKESFWARSVLVNAARAAGIQALDGVYSDVVDTEGLLAAAGEARSLGFEGKGCIHPRQIEIVHRAFAPTREEVEKAQAIVDAYEKAKATGHSVAVLDGKMIDAPVVKRAVKLLEQAKKQ